MLAEGTRYSPELQSPLKDSASSSYTRAESPLAPEEHRLKPLEEEEEVFHDDQQVMKVQ